MLFYQIKIKEEFMTDMANKDYNLVEVRQDLLVTLAEGLEIMISSPSQEQRMSSRTSLEDETHLLILWIKMISWILGLINRMQSHHPSKLNKMILLLLLKALIMI